jgi:DHA2 family multidrug resistance protein
VQPIINYAKYSRILPPTQFILLNLALGLGHFIVLLNAGAYLPMLPYVSGSAGEGIGYVEWGQIDYFTAMGASMLIARPIMQHYGPKNSAIFAYLLFSTSSFAALQTIPFFSVYTSIRVIQGFAAGISIIPSFFLLLEYYTEDQQKMAVSLWSLALFVPYTVGPALGGWFAYELGDWRLLFESSSILSLVIAAIIWALLADWEDKPEKSPRFFKSSLFLFGLFFSSAIALLSFFDVGILTAVTSDEITLWQIFMAFLFLSWLFWLKNGESRTPLIKFSMFNHPNYGFSMLILCLSFLGFQGSIVQYLLRIQLIEGYTAWHAGLIFLPLFVFSKPLNMLAQKLIHQGLDPRIPASIALIGFSASYWWISSYIRPATWETLLWPQILMGAAMGLFFVSMTALALGHVPKKEQIHAVDVLNSFRTLSAALGITISDIAWDRITAHELNRLSSPDAGNALRYASTFDNDAAFHLAHEKFVQTASLLTLNDLFYLLSLTFIALAAMVWLLRPDARKESDMIILENLGEEP